VSWLDKEEWPQTLKNALNKLWAMYFEENNARIDERVQNGELVKQLSDEKNKIEKNYSTLMNDVSKFMDATEKRIVEQNYRKIMSAEAETVSKGDLKARDLLKTEVTKLRSELKELKQVHKSQAEVMKEKQLRLEGERDVLKEEKRKLEYMLYDMLKASDSLKEKVKKIKSICDD
jgi:exonuclease VII large subunit